MKRGHFIVIDGGEGSGKSSLIEIAKKEFANDFVFTRETGGTPFAETIREITHEEKFKDIPAESFFGLVWAARAEHIRSKIEPALKAGKNVLSDRFDSSTYAYQICGQEGKGLEKLFWDTRKIFLAGTEPDLYIFLDVDPKIGLARAKSRGGEITHFDMRKLPFHEKVRSGFKKFLSKMPHEIIDSNRSFEEVKKEFLALVGKVVGR